MLNLEPVFLLSFSHLRRLCNFSYYIEIDLEVLSCIQIAQCFPF